MIIRKFRSLRLNNQQYKVSNLHQKHNKGIAVTFYYTNYMCIKTSWNKASDLIFFLSIAVLPILDITMDNYSAYNKKSLTMLS